MSRADNLNAQKNPAKRFYSWKNGEMVYWDKELSENIAEPLPIKFIFINSYSVIKGYDAKTESGVTSNEVTDLSSEIITVRSFKGGVMAKGLYSEIKERVLDNNIRFHVSLYALMNNELVNFSFKGAALGSWIEFAKEHKNRLLDNYIAINDIKTQKKGGVTYSFPIFSSGEKVSSDLYDLAEKFDTELKEYQKNKKSNPTSYDVPDNHKVSEVDEEVGF